jgi:hypothetical protein
LGDHICDLSDRNTVAGCELVESAPGFLYTKVSTLGVVYSVKEFLSVKRRNSFREDLFECIGIKNTTQHRDLIRGRVFAIHEDREFVINIGVVPVILVVQVCQHEEATESISNNIIAAGYVCNLEVKRLQVYPPAYDHGNLGGFHPSKVVVVSLNDIVLATQIIIKFLHGVEDAVPFLLNSRPILSRCRREFLRTEGNDLLFNASIRVCVELD